MIKPSHYAKKLKERNTDVHLKNEALYFESSAYYHLKEYEKALTIAKQHVLSLNKEIEPHTYLNAFINYTSIYYVYIWYNNDYQKLQDIRKIIFILLDMQKESILKHKPMPIGD